jgi:SulP family sulfate permease
MANNIKISLPLIGTLKSYKKSWVRKDLVAGMTVAAVAVPQAMAYAQLAGLPLAIGLYTALVAMLFFAVFTTSRYAIVGPDAAMAALTGATVIPLANGDIGRYTSLVAVLAILIGAVCLIAVFARLGILAELISRPILLGYMAGLALAVIASQAPKLFGITVPAQGNFFTTIWYILTHIGLISWVTVGFSLIILAAAIFIQTYVNKIPMSLVILVGSIILSAALGLQDKGIAVVGDIPTGLPTPQWPSITIVDFQNLVVPALMIALVSYANTIATARSFAKHQKEDIEAPQEFFGLGISNIGSGIFGGMPVAASGARTAVNQESKAVTQVSQLFGAVSIAVVLLFLAKFLSYLPLAALAVIVIMAVKNLFNYKELKSISHAWRSEAILAIITLVGVTILGIFQGLLLAVLLAVMNLVRRNTLPKYAVLGQAEDGSLRDMSRPPKTKAIPGVIIFRFDAPLYFVNANYFKDTVYQLIEESEDEVKWFLWDAETITELDSTAGQMLLVLIRDLKSKGITFAIARMKGPIRKTVSKSHRLAYTFSSTPHFTSMGDALEEFNNQQKTEKSDKKIKA